MKKPLAGYINTSPLYFAYKTYPIPEPNAINQIIRSIVEICEHALPEVISFLKIDKRAQNYEKFPILCGFHDRVMILSDPLQILRMAI